MRTHLARVCFAISVGLACFNSASAQNPFFEVLEQFDTGRTASAEAVSSDGSTVVGTADLVIGTHRVQQAVLWQGGIIAGLGFLGPMTDPRVSWAYDISEDASVIVGQAEYQGSGQRVSQAARWIGAAITGLDGDGGKALGVSDDGSTIVGWYNDPAGQWTRPVRWSGGAPTELGVIGTDPKHGVALGISGDGSTIVGTYVHSVNGIETTQAWRWQDGTMSFLDFLNSAIPDPFGRANGASRDGSLIVGRSFGTVTGQPVIWKNGIVTALSEASGEATDVSGDGNVVVGFFTNAEFQQRAFIWTNEGGFEDLGDFMLDAHGIDMSRLEGIVANAISSDGTVIVGKAWDTVTLKNVGWRIGLGPSEDPLIVNVTTDASDLDGKDACDTDASEEGNQCSLRAALELAEIRAERDSISFNIPGAGPHIISLGQPLPTMTQPVVIDAMTQPAYNGVPLVVLDGAGLAGNGLSLTAGASTVRGLVIGGFLGSGIHITGPGGTGVEACFIGTDATGSSAFSNSTGVSVMESPDNHVGSASEGRGNVISGNSQDGVAIEGSSAVGNSIAGNYIGVSAAGTAGLGNGLAGVRISDAGSNTVGGLTSVPGTAPGNVISGQAVGTGVYVVGHAAGAEANKVQGNLIGTNTDGTAALPNITGVLVAGNAPNTLIGGTESDARNVISGNTEDGVRLIDAEGIEGPTGSTIAGNYIGTSRDGLTGIPNAKRGVVVTSTSVENGDNGEGGVAQVTIGGEAEGAGNVVAANRHQVVIAGFTSSRATVANNFIGIFADGESGEPAVEQIVPGQQLTGIQVVFAERVRVGLPGAGNVVGGNTIGVWLLSHSTIVQGNIIGANPGGTLRRPNTIGIVVAGVDSTIIGSADDPDGRNQISGNTRTGIRISDFPEANSTTRPVLAAVAKSKALRTGDQKIMDDYADLTMILGNYIGTTRSGTQQLGNGRAADILDTFGGIDIWDGAKRTQVAGNVISGNGYGISIVTTEFEPTEANVIVGNRIGTRASSLEFVPNQYDGIRVFGGTDNVIGGTEVALANVIAGNGGAGIVVGNSQYTQATGNRIRGNAIFDNGGLGIDLLPEGVLQISPANTIPGFGSFNQPVLVSTVLGGLDVVVRGHVDDAMSIDVFASPRCDTKYGHGEGALFLGSFEATAGTAFGAPLPLPVEVNEGFYITATATNVGGITTEFSECVRIARTEHTDVFDLGASTEADLTNAEVQLEITTGGAAAKRARSVEYLYVSRFDTPPDNDFFIDSTAVSDDGSAIRPEDVASARYWSVLPDKAGDLMYTACLRYDGVGGILDPGKLIVVTRRNLSWPWRGHDTTLRSDGDRNFVCAAGLTEFGDVAIGADATNPVPIAETEDEDVPAELAISSIYPNPAPASASVTVDYEVPVPGTVHVSVFDVGGRATVDAFLPAESGRHSVSFDTNRWASGVYLVRLVVAGVTTSRRFAVVR